MRLPDLGTAGKKIRSAFSTGKKRTPLWGREKSPRIQRRAEKPLFRGREKSPRIQCRAEKKTRTFVRG